MDHRKNFRYSPTTPSEKRAMFLEETLTRMQTHSDHLFKKQRALARQNKPFKHIKNKLADINKGVQEVSDKANNAWKTVAKEGRL